MKTKISKNINYRSQIVVNLYRIKRLAFVCALGLSFLVLPEVWSDVRFEMDPGKVADAETRMWQAYYANDHIMLRQEIENLLNCQFGISVSDAKEIGESLASAAMKFESAKSNYKLTVLPDLERAYSLLKNKLDISFDPKEAAKAVLDWWVARRTPGRDSPEEVGRLIAHLYVVLFGEDKPAFGRAGLLRARAARVRDEGGVLCNWDTVEYLLHESYQALQEGLRLASNSYSGQVTLSWDENTENNVVGYKIYYGESSGNYGPNVDVGNQTSYTIKDLEGGKSYYFVVTAYNTSGVEGGHSAEVSHKAIVGITSPLLPQKPAEENALQKVEKGETSGIESSYSAEVSHKAPVGITSPSLPQKPTEENALQKVEKGETSGIESSYSAEVSHKATVSITSPSLPQKPTEENALQNEVNHKAPVGITPPSPPQEPVDEHALHKVENGELQQINIPVQNIEVVWLSQEVDLTRHSKGPFTVKARVEGVDEQRHVAVFPRIMYHIGTGSHYGYFDMIHEGDGVWRFDIPDPKWKRYRSNNLHYQVKVFDEEGDVIVQSHWEIELIDSFTRQN
jgi:hypothetical protein